MRGIRSMPSTLRKVSFVPIVLFFCTPVMAALSESSCRSSFPPAHAWRPSRGFSGRPRLRAEPAAPGIASAVDLILFERDNAFEALAERRLQLRLESPLPLIDVPVVAELEIAGRLIARGRTSFATVPVTVPRNSPLFAALYSDYALGKVLESGKASLRISVHGSASVHVELQRPAASIDWSEGTPRPVRDQP